MHNMNTTKLLTKVVKQIAQETIDYYTGKKIKYTYNDYFDDESKRVTIYCIIERVNFNMNDNRFTFSVYNHKNKKDTFWIGDEETFEVIYD